MRSDALALAPARPRAAGWVARGGLAVVDQGLHAAAMFVVGVLLARWLAPDAFGAFAIAAGVLLIVSSVHDALVLEPASVLGPSTYRDTFDAYLHALGRLNARAVVAAGTALAAIGLALWARGVDPVGPALTGIGLAVPGLLSLLVVRRMFYLRRAPALAAIASGLFLLAAVGGMVALGATGAASPFAGALVLGIAAAFGARAVAPLTGSVRGAVERAAVASVHWRYGRWLAGPTLIYVAAAHAHVFLLGSMAGLEPAGSLRALLVLTVPVQHSITAIAAIVLPAMAAQTHDRAALLRRARTTTLALTGTAVAAWIILVAGGRWIEQAVYGGKFAADVHLLPILALAPVFTAVLTGASLVLRALHRPRYYVAVAGGAGAMAIGPGTAMVALWGITGAAAAAAATAGAAALAAVLVLRSTVREETP